MAAWPSGLPQLSLLEGAFEAGQGVTVRSEVDVGPAKVRRRYTDEVVRFSVPLILTAAQVDILETFYSTTLDAIDPFDWTHPRTRVAVSFAFVSRPSYSPIGAGFYQTSLELEQQL